MDEGVNQYPIEGEPSVKGDGQSPTEKKSSEEQDNQSPNDEDTDEEQVTNETGQRRSSRNKPLVDYSKM